MKAQGCLKKQRRKDDIKNEVVRQRQPNIDARQCKADAGNNKANRVRKRQPPRDDGDKNCDKE